MTFGGLDVSSLVAAALTAAPEWPLLGLAQTGGWNPRSPAHRCASALQRFVGIEALAKVDPKQLAERTRACVEARRGKREVQAGDLIAARLAIGGPDTAALLEHLLDSLATDAPATNYLSKRLRAAGVHVPTGLLIADYTSDVVAGHGPDLIGGVEREATAFARVCVSRQIDPPLAIGVFGQWGAGKSYFMEKVHGAIEQLCKHQHAHDKLFHGHVVQIRFNAWHYIETNLWASLVEHIFTELDDWLRQDDNDLEAHDVERLFERLSTSRLLKLEAVGELVARRRRKAGAAEAVIHERRSFREALRSQQAAREREFPWTEVMTALADTQDWNTHELEQAGRVLGIDALHESGSKLATVLEQSLDAGARMRLTMSALSARFGRTWPWFIVIVAFFTIVPFLLTKLPADSILGGWDTIQSAAASAVGVVAALAAMLGSGLRAAESAIEQVEKQRKLFESQVEKQREQLRTELTRAENKLAETKGAVRRAEDHLAYAEREVANAAEAFNWGSARGRLNRFIRDKVTSGDYARHLGLVTSIRRDFVELARLMQAVDEDEAPDAHRDHEAQEFEANYKRRVEDTILRVVTEFCARDHEGARAYQAEVEQIIGKPLEPGKPDHAAAQSGSSRARDLTPEPLLTIDEVRRLWTGLGLGADIPPAFERIVLYIDDLDRCPPAKVVEVLQAAHLLLGFRLFVVLIAVDERWVSRALARHYAEMLLDPRDSSRTSEGAATSHDYLEKIFQIPYWVRPMADIASQSYIDGLLGPRERKQAIEPASTMLTAASEAVAIEVAPEPSEPGPTSRRCPRPRTMPSCVASSARRGCTSRPIACACVVPSTWPSARA